MFANVSLYFSPKCCPTLRVYFTAILIDKLDNRSWHQADVLHYRWFLLMWYLGYVRWFPVLWQVCGHDTQPSCLLASIDSPNSPRQPMHSWLDTPLHTHSYVFSLFPNGTAHRHASQANNNNLPCQSRLHRHKNDSSVVHLHNCYVSERHWNWRSNTLCDKAWQVKTSIAITIHDENVLELTPVISKHADVNIPPDVWTDKTLRFTFLRLNFMLTFF